MWKSILKWGVRIVTLGLLLRETKLKPRDVVPGMVAAALVGYTGSETPSAILERVYAQIEQMAWDGQTKSIARAYASQELRMRVGW